MNMANPVDPHDTDSVIEDALQTFPVADVPPGMTDAVMRRVRRFAPAPRFRLAWLDVALPTFAAALVGVALLLLFAIPETTAENAEGYLVILATRLNLALFLPILAGGLLLAGLAVAAAAVLFHNAGGAPGRVQRR